MVHRVPRSAVIRAASLPAELDRTLADSRDDASGDQCADVLAFTPRARRCPTCGVELPGSFVVCPHDATPLGVASSREDPLVGIVLAGTYRLVRAIGKGGMGKLYEAEHTRLRRRFAVKVLHESHAEKADAVRRFEREAEALARISSDHVLDVVDVLRTPDDRTAIVTGLLEGEDLQRRLERARHLPPAEAIEIARQICRGLAAAHAVRVVHRDLKPSNLFLQATSDGTLAVKILDFGVAKLGGANDVTRTGVVLGTPAYMAPEQARGSNKADTRSDVYAVGAVLYRMVTGRMPYDGKDVTATLSQLLHEAPPRPRSIRLDIPLALESVIQRAMSRDPSERPRSALELETMLGEIAGQSVKPAAVVGAAGRAERAPDTMVLGRGDVARATQIEREARSARPRAIAESLVAVLLAACAGALAFHAPVALVSTPSAPHEELSLAMALVGAVAAAAGAITALVRTLRPRWASAPEVDRAREALHAMMRRGLTAFGATVSLPLALATVELAPPPSIAALCLAAVALSTLAAVAPAATRR